MMDAGGKWDEDECSVIGDEGQIGFIDYEDEKSVCSYNPLDEGPVVISVPFPFSNRKPQSIFVGQTTADSVTINNTTNEPIDLWAIRIYASNPKESFTISLMKPPSVDSDVEAVRGFLESYSMEDRVLQPGKTLTIWISCKPKEIGLHTTVVHFVVGDDTIERVIFLLADDKISHSLASKKPFSKGMRKKHFSVDEFVPGKRPQRPANRVPKYKLPLYPIPKEIREEIGSKQLPDVISVGLSRNNYARYFKTLLVMEEMQLEEDMRTYGMENVTMRRLGYRLVSLEVPGLAERRPSLVHGDSVFAKLSDEDASGTGRPYQGYIHRVEADHVFLKFSDGFHAYHRNEDRYNIQFSYNRLTMRRLYQAVEAADCLETKLLFPSKSFGTREIKTTPMVPISCTINEEQMCAIEKILGCKGVPPYIIHGPPGTGKTMTLVEALLQLYKTRRSARILVCAPSNSAADHILEKILGVKEFEVQENELFRLNASSRPYEEVSPDYLTFCYFEELIFKCPPLEALMRYRIIISTYMSAALLYSEGIGRGHFTHIFVDEAGQASEPESMIPISHLCRRETVVVLAGDPMQLGPVVFSKDAEAYGLGKSYLERLFECELYGDGDANYITKLVRNYRCHPEILSLPSKLFYKGELIACKDDSSSDTPWVDVFTNQKFPVLFLGIEGCDEREGSNPSWFNRIEASKVVEIVKKLLACGDLGEDGIGIITPYRQQVNKIKAALECLEMSDIKVGSVEQYQGQEKQVIIISTVRSTIRHNDFDRTHSLGFLTNPRRFNVAVTRARSLLIIIGNPHIVSEDMYWHKLLWHCSDNDSYKGCGLPERKDFDHEDLHEKEYGDNKLILDRFLNNNEGNHQFSDNFEWRPSEDVEASNLEPERSTDVYWGQDPCDDVPTPVTNGEAGWSSEKAPKSIANGGQDWPHQEAPKDDSDGGGDGSCEKSSHPASESVADWSFQDFCKPVTDESEWSDGWRD